MDGIEMSDNTPFIIPPNETDPYQLLSENRLNEFATAIQELDLNRPHKGLKHGRTLLYEAIDRGNEEAVRILLQTGATPFQFYKKLNTTSIHMAAERAAVGILALLLDALEDEEKLNFQVGVTHKTPLHAAIEAGIGSDGEMMQSAAECVRILLRRNPDLGLEDGNGHTALAIAESNGFNEIADKLTVEGARDCRDPLDLWGALVDGSPENFRQVLESEPGDLSNSERRGQTLLQIACEKERVEMAGILLEIGAHAIGTTRLCTTPPFFIAAKKNNPVLIDMLLRHMQVSGIKTSGLLPSKKIIAERADNIFHVLLKQDIQENADWPTINRVHDCLDLLLKADDVIMTPIDTLVNQIDTSHQGSTPLHYATLFPCQAIPRMLLAHGADKSLFITNKEGWEPINKLLPETLQSFLNDCIEFDGNPMEVCFKITLKNRMFLPPLVVKDSGELNKETSKFYVDQNDDPIPESEYLLRLKRSHKDSYDHPIVSGLIWYKWRKARLIYRFIDVWRLLMHLVGLLYVVFTFGGRSFYTLADAKPSYACWNATSFRYLWGNEEMEFVPKNCCPKFLSDITNYFLIFFWFIHTIKLFAQMSMYVIRALVLTNDSESRWMRLHDQFLIAWTVEVKIMVGLVFSIPGILAWVWSDPWDGNYAARRDLAGLYIVLTSFDLCLLIRDHISGGHASMFNWLMVVSESMIRFLLVHALLLFGFGFCFYIQLHRDTGEEDNVFSTFPLLPLKIFAMLVGELEFADHPFRETQIWNYITFLLFVFFIVLVMLNLLTGVAVLDVQEISNQSGDRALFSLTKSMYLIEEALILLNKFLPQRFANFVRRKAYAYNCVGTEDVAMVIFPNQSRALPSRTKKEIYIQDSAIKRKAKEIVLEKLISDEKENLKTKPDLMESALEDLSQRMASIEKLLQDNYQ